MNDVYIKATDLNRWIVKHLPSNQDLYSINDLIGAIEDLDGEINELNDQIEEKQNTIDELIKEIKRK